MVIACVKENLLEVIERKYLDNENGMDFGREASNNELFLLCVMCVHSLFSYVTKATFNENIDAKNPIGLSEIRILDLLILWPMSLQFRYLYKALSAW